MAVLVKNGLSIFNRQSALFSRLQHVAVNSKKHTCLCSKALNTGSRPPGRGGAGGWLPALPQTRHMTRRAIDGTKKRSLAPVEELDVTAQRRFSCLLRPLGFTLLVSGCSFSGTIVWQYETLRSHFQKTKNNVQQAFKQGFYGKAGSFRHHINHWWNTMTPAKQMVAAIIGVNTAVFAMWKIRPLQSVMMKYFASSPFSGAPCLSMVLSTFSHYSLIHLGANMFVLWSFSSPISDSLGKEQLMGFYLTAGVVSGFTSYLYKVARASPVPSLGASGVILAILGYVCCQFPDSRLSIAFVDMLIPHSFSADTAMKSLIAFDALGILLGWRLFDHAAHLGGMLFGIWYHKYGQDIVWKKYREPVMKKWHDLRGKP